MLSTETILELKEQSENVTILYVEDNDGLREKAIKLLKKLLHNVYHAADGQEGYEAFKKYRPDIVITDIRMPNMDGLEMIEHIKKVSPSTKFIITSAFDEKEYLFKAIQSGVFDYINKPVKVDKLADTLIKCIDAINLEESSSLFNDYMEDVVNYQSDLLALMSKSSILFVNQMFLNFFNVENIEEFNLKYKNFGDLLLPHNGFLYNHDDVEWLGETTNQLDKLFHIKIVDLKSENRHFILKMHRLPKKNNTYIMSLNDITDLQLLSLFDSKAVENDERIKSRSTILNLMEVIHKNHAEVKIHNYYKGLTVTNLGLITDIKNDYITIKSSFMQQKAAQYQNSMFISSEIFPSAIYCESIEKVDYDKQTITFKDMKFAPTSPIDRKSVRVSAEESHSVSLLFENLKFHGDVKISDISVEAVKLELNALPAGLRKDESVYVDMVFEYDRKHLIINTPATVLRIDEMPKSYMLILILELSSAHKKLLIDYIARRQMVLIREFKGLQFV